jgi:hypothetical protein
MRHHRRSNPRRSRLHESIRLYLQMQKATTEEEFQSLLVQHDACTDADGVPRLSARTLAEFRAGPVVSPSSIMIASKERTSDRQ